MNTGKRVMRFDSVPYNLQERIRAAENKVKRSRKDSVSRGAKGQSGAAAARQRMIDSMGGKASQEILTAERAYELFTADTTGAAEARQRMIERQRSCGRK